MKILYDGAKREHRWKLKRTNGQAIGLILLIVLAFFVTKWVLQGAYFKNDLVVITIPLEDLYARIQRSGQSPFWAPELAGGYPLLAIGQLGFWYPLHMLLRQFLPAVWTLNLSMMLHAMLAAIGTFLFLKHNKINKVAAGSAALLLPLGATFVGKYEMVNLVLPFMWVPLIFLFLQLFMEHGKPIHFLVWIGANSLCVLVGHPQMTVYVLFSEAIFVLCLTGLQWRRWLRAIMILLGVFLILGLTSFYLLPIVDNIPATDRAAGSGDEDSNNVFDFQFSPKSLSGLFLAHPFGHGANYFGPKNESELSCYFGPLALGLAVLGLFVGWRKFPVVWWLALSLIVVGLSLAIGGYSPIFRWIVHHGWKYFSNPSRFIFYVHIGIVLLMAVGLDFCISHLKFLQAKINKIIIGFILVGTIVPALWVSWTWDKGVPWNFTKVPILAKIMQQESGFVRLASLSKESVVNIAPDNDFGIMVWNSVFSKRVYRQSFISPFNVVNGIAVKLSRPQSGNGVVTIALYKKSGEKIRESSLATQNIVDGEWSNFTFQSLENTEGKEFYFEINSNVERQQQGPRLFIHTNPSEQYDPTGVLFNCIRGACAEVDSNFKSTDVAFKLLTNQTQAVSAQEALVAYISASFGIKSSLWAGSLPIFDVKRYIKPIEGSLIGHESYATINRFPVTHLIGIYPPYRYATNLESVSLMASVPFGDQFIRLYRNNQAFPHLQFVQKVKAIVDSINQIKALSQLDPNDQKIVVADVSKDAVFDTSGNKAKIIKDGRTQVIIQTEQDTEGFLVLRDVLLKGWEATIDGRPVNINRVDGIFRGVLVPAGKHAVIFNYSPKWVRPAIYIEIISIGIFIMLIVLACRQSQNSKQKQNVL